MSEFSGVSSVDDLFNTLTTDERVARALLRSETLQLARQVGVAVPKTRITELELARLARERWASGLGPRTCAGCVLQGRRWHKMNQGLPLLLALDTHSLEKAYPRAIECIDDALDNITTLHPEILVRRARDGETPDVDMRGGEIDGRGSTLGFAITYTTPDTDDLDVGGDRWVSAEMVLDWAELWTYDFLFTVFTHEFCHILGIDHSPITIRDDIMFAYYQRDRRDLGDWTTQQLINRLIGVAPA